MKWTDETSFISRGNSFKLTLPRLQKITNCGETLALFFSVCGILLHSFQVATDSFRFFLFCSTPLITLEWSTAAPCVSCCSLSQFENYPREEVLIDGWCHFYKVFIYRLSNFCFESILQYLGICFEIFRWFIRGLF